MPSLKTRALSQREGPPAGLRRRGRLVGHRLLGMPTLLLRTTGRRSGQTRASALVSAEDAGRRLLYASNGRRRRPPAWLLNLEADPSVEVQVGRRREPTITTASAPTTRTTRGCSRCGPGQQGAVSRFQRRADRELAVVVLTPA